MALGHNPSIVTSNLLLCLDAANPRSYPGSGSTWYDISGNNNNFTLYNTTYSSGAINFNGTNAYAATINNLNLGGYNSISVETWFKASTTGDSMIIEHTPNWNSNTGGWGLYINSTGSAPSVGMMHTNHNSEGARNYNLSIGTNWNTQTNIFSIVADNTGRLTYGNGDLLTFVTGPGYPTSTVTTTGGSFANAILYLASRAGTGGFYNGAISIIRIYGMKLTSSQITQNYLAMRGRYNI